MTKDKLIELLLDFSIIGCINVNKRKKNREIKCIEDVTLSNDRGLCAACCANFILKQFDAEKDELKAELKNSQLHRIGKHNV